MKKQIELFDVSSGESTYLKAAQSKLGEDTYTRHKVDPGLSNANEYISANRRPEMGSDAWRKYGVSRLGATQQEEDQGSTSLPSACLNTRAGRYEFVSFQIYTV